MLKELAELAERAQLCVTGEGSSYMSALFELEILPSQICLAALGEVTLSGRRCMEL